MSKRYLYTYVKIWLQFAIIYEHLDCTVTLKQNKLADLLRKYADQIKIAHCVATCSYTASNVGLVGSRSPIEFDAAKAQEFHTNNALYFIHPSMDITTPHPRYYSRIYKSVLTVALYTCLLYNLDPELE